jgi:beta-lactamase class A
LIAPAPPREGAGVIIRSVLKGGVLAMVLGVACVLAGVWTGYATAGPGRPGLPQVQVPALQGVPPAPVGPAAAAHPAFDGLQASVTQLIRAAGGNGGVALVELGGPAPQSWSFQGDTPFVAASTYKLPLLMEEAQNVTGGRWRGTESVCYRDGDWEDGWYTDYTDGLCLSRAQLEHRIGHDSDNTAAHMLIRVDGGPNVLNQYAKAHGAQASSFFEPNNTTPNDLARLWSDEAAGRAGGRPAQQYLYPMLTQTSFERGIPAGVPAGTTVVHKIGELDDVVNDAALVQQGPRGPYVLVVCTEGVGGDAGWKLVADVSRAVWQFESTR